MSRTFGRRIEALERRPASQICGECGQFRDDPRYANAPIPPGRLSEAEVEAYAAATAPRFGYTAWPRCAFCDSLLPLSQLGAR
jgi:hypothetical protein